MVSFGLANLVNPPRLEDGLHDGQPFPVLDKLGHIDRSHDVNVLVGVRRYEDHVIRFDHDVFAGLALNEEAGKIVFDLVPVPQYVGPFQIGLLGVLDLAQELKKSSPLDQ